MRARIGRYVFGRADPDHLAAAIAAFGSEVDDVIRSLVAFGIFTDELVIFGPVNKICNVICTTDFLTTNFLRWDQVVTYLRM